MGKCSGSWRRVSGHTCKKTHVWKACICFGYKCECTRDSVPVAQASMQACDHVCSPAGMCSGYVAVSMHVSALCTRWEHV